MPRTVTKEVFSYSELSDKAKEKARDWYRDGGFDYQWWDSTYDDFKTICDKLGIELGTRRNSKELTVYFSGFWSQGDGACFTGSYRYAKGAAKAIREYAPQDAKLHSIADQLEAMQRKRFYRVRVEIGQHSSHYSHSGTMCADAFDVVTGADLDSDVARDFLDTLRQLADWLYKTLEAEYEYISSDDAVAETIEANEYEFEADGSRTRD